MRISDSLTNETKDNELKVRVNNYEIDFDNNIIKDTNSGKESPISEQENDTIYRS
jgi:hypothetical protein